MHNIHFRAGLPFDAFGISISRHTEWGLIGSRDNVFPGPAVAIDGPEVQLWFSESNHPVGFPQQLWASHSSDAKFRETYLQ